MNEVSKGFTYKFPGKQFHRNPSISFLGLLDWRKATYWNCLGLRLDEMKHQASTTNQITEANLLPPPHFETMTD